MNGIPPRDITVDKDNMKWVSSAWAGIVGCSDSSSNWINYNIANSGMPSDFVNCIAIDSANRKWLAAEYLYLLSIAEENPIFTSPTLTTCLNSTLTFANQTTGADSFTWKIDNQIVDTSTNLTYTFTTTGVKRVELVAHKGNINKSFFQYITVRTPVQVNMGNDTSVCHNSFVIEANAAAEIYLWKDLPGTLLEPDSVNEEFTVSGMGTHIVVLEGTDYCGAVDRDTITVMLTGDCVLPGDVNADGGVDMLDFVALQPLIGQTGTPRPSASTTLSYQNCPNWSGNQPAPYNTVNQKHGDCDGRANASK